MPGNAGPSTLLGTVLAAMLVLWGAPAAAQASAGDAARGRLLAERLCTNCHVLAPGTSSSVTVGIPSFPEMARRPEQTAEWLAGRLMAPHPPMPDASLTAAEIRDLAAYILSLKGGQ
jgi:cytochrome c